MLKTITSLCAVFLLAGCGCTTTATIPLANDAKLEFQCRGDSAERLAAQYFALATMVNQTSQFSAMALAAKVKAEENGEQTGNGAPVVPE